MFYMETEDGEGELGCDRLRDMRQVLKQWTCVRGEVTTAWPQPDSQTSPLPRTA